jgi:iron complex outermembrane receptor protein
VDTQNGLFRQALAQNAQIFGSASPPDLLLSSPVYGFPIDNPLTDPTSASNNSIRQTSEQAGLYIQDQMKLGRLSVVAGGRYDSARSTTITTNLADPLIDPTPNSTVRQSDHATTGRVGVVYEFDSGVAPFATYATSFNPTAGVTLGGEPLKPTTGELYEVGVKYQPKGGRIFIQASIFDLTQQNVVSVDPIAPLVKTQIGEVRSRGFEIEGRASLSDSLDVLASYTYVDPRVTKSLDIDLGKIPTWIPRQIAAVWGDYTIREGALNGLGFGLGIRYTGATFGDAANSIEVPSYALVDASIHYELANLDPRLKGAKLSINATNLFDKVYVSQCTVQFDNNCVYGLRRQILATLRYKW